MDRPASRNSFANFSGTETVSALRIFCLCGLVLLGFPGAMANAQTALPGPTSAVDGSDSLYGTSSSTIRDLLRTARRQVGMQQLEAAGITLERALAIEPDNAVLWNALARLRYRQAGYREVQSLTQRSESLADGNADLVLRNRQLAAAAQDAIAGNVVPIVDLDLQTPNAALLNSTGVATGSANNGGALPGATNDARIERPTVIAPQPLPGSPSAPAQSLPHELPSAGTQRSVQVSENGAGSGVTAPNVVGNTTVYNVPTPSQNIPRSIPRPASTPRPVWNNQPTVVTPAPSPQPTQRTQTPAVASSSGIEERSFNHYGRGGRGVPRQYLPPPGMCRLWFDNRDAAGQPAPADCRTLRRNVPAGARLIVGEHRYSWDPFRIRN